MEAAGRRPGKQASGQSACRDRWPEPSLSCVWLDPLSEAKRSRKDPSRPAWLGRGPVTTAGATGGWPGGRCRDLTWPEAHRFTPRPHRAAGGETHP
jgi:hypothetical protein